MTAARLRVGLALIGAIFSLPILGLGCGEIVEVSLGQEFDLSLGREAAVASEKVVVRFVAVPLDSRCPRGDQCITAGKARVDLEISVGGASPQAARLETSGGSGEAVVQGFELTLVGLRPQPVSGRAISSQEYVATLILRRL